MKIIKELTTTTVEGQQYYDLLKEMHKVITVKIDGKNVPFEVCFNFGKPHKKSNEKINIYLGEK